MVDKEEAQEPKEPKPKGSARTSAKKKDTAAKDEAPKEEAPKADAPHEEPAEETAETKKSFEEKLDSFADKFSHALSDGVKRMESAFEKGSQEIRDNPNFSKSRVRGFFTSSAGGSILVVIGFIWLFYAIGLLDKPVFPALMIIVGFYIMHRYKSGD